MNECLCRLLLRSVATLPCLLYFREQSSKFALFSVSGLKDEKLIKKKAYITRKPS